MSVQLGAKQVRCENDFIKKRSIGKKNLEVEKKILS